MENNNQKEYNNNIICGRNPVLEAVRSGREIDRLLVAHGVSGGSVSEIIAKCSARGILIKEISPQKLDYYCGGANHQGVAVMFAAQEYSTVKDILNYAEEKGEKPFIIICDEIEDPHNLGAIRKTKNFLSIRDLSDFIQNQLKKKLFFVERNQKFNRHNSLIYNKIRIFAARFSIS